MAFNLAILTATLADYPVIQNMARFYVYDLSRYCGFISKDWAIPEDGLHECFDFKNYFVDPSCKAYIIKVNQELAGFILLNKTATEPDTDWNMGEFFILAKFQNKGLGQIIAKQIWNSHPGKWEVSVIPENTPAELFWHKTISNYTQGHFTRQIKQITYDTDQPNRIIFSFGIDKI